MNQQIPSPRDGHWITVEEVEARGAAMGRAEGRAEGRAALLALARSVAPDQVDRLSRIRSIVELQQALERVLKDAQR